MADKTDDDIPLADDDPQVIIYDDDPEESNESGLNHGQSMESIQSSFTNDSAASPRHDQGLELDSAIDELEEKARFITQVLELQNTLDDLSQRLDHVKEENLRLKSENMVLGQYIENLMSASSVFQTTPKVKKK